MTGLGERSHLLGPEVDLNLHIRDIAAVLHYEDVHDVILVGHSYGGMVITGAAARCADRVAKLVYLDAQKPKGGEALVDLSGRVLAWVRPAGRVVDGLELVLLPSPQAESVYGVSDPDDLAWMADRLTGHPWKTFEQKLELPDENGYSMIPHYHIVCTSTLATRDPQLMEQARSSGRLWDIDTGHDLMITEPHQVTEALLAVAES